MYFLLRALVIFVLVLTALSAIRRLLAPASERSVGESERSSAQGGKLVRDPVCGTYVAAAQALSADRNAETFHFCSEECRDKFLTAAGTS